jgi:CubicO group peptidase (beta-lactamase class C family)
MVAPLWRITLDLTRKATMRQRGTLLLLFARIFLVIPSLAQPANEADSKYELLDAQIRQILKQTGVVGVSVAVIEHYKVAWAKGFGLKQVGSPDSITRETLFQAASITKAVTAMAAMRKVQEGKLALEEDVNQTLTAWKLPYQDQENPITLKQLLSHTSQAGISGPKRADALPPQAYSTTGHQLFLFGTELRNHSTNAF